jgi:CBS domain-containing protein
MKTEVFTLRPETTLAETLRVLVEKKAKRLVVADESGHLLGMVDRDRLLRALADE